MGIETGLKVGINALTQVAKKAYVKPICEVRTLESLGLKMKQLTGDVVHSGKISLKEIGEIKIDDIVPVDGLSKYTYYKHVKSLEMKRFDSILSNIDRSKGLSTPPYAGGVFLRGSTNIPLGTSGVGNCAVVCLYNSGTGTHSIYHAAPIFHNAVNLMKKDIMLVMPEGFDRTIFIAGRNPETAVTINNLFKAVKSINPDAAAGFKHTTDEGLVEFVSYNGNVYSKLLKDNDPLFTVTNPYEYEAVLKKLSLCS